MSKNIIKLNRGDSFERLIAIQKKDGSNYLLDSDTDMVYFALMEPHQLFEEAIFIKGFTKEDQDENTGNICIKITPNDTRELMPGVYYYTIKLQRGGTLNTIDDLDEPIEVKTIIDRTKFIIFD